MAEADISMPKKCARCKLVLPLSSFNKNKSKRDGRGTECRGCANEHSRKYHLNNLDAHKDRLKAYREANPEKFKQWSAARYAAIDKGKEYLRKKLDRQENPERWREYNRKYWLRNAEACRQRKREYRQKFPGLAMVYVRNRQTRKKRAMPSWANVEAIKAIYRQSAWATKVSGVKHHVDHYYPLKSDIVCGLHNEFNLRIISAVDNLSKGNRFPIEEIYYAHSS